MQEKNKKTQVVVPNRLIIDAENAILGRLCSKVAKLLLEGNRVDIVNCEKAIISGKRKSILKEYLDLHKKHTLSNPRRGPFHPKRPDRIVRRSVRGMLPMKKTRGTDAYHRLLTHIGVPPEFNNKEFITIDEANANKLKCKYITVGDLSKEFGWVE